MNKVQQVINFWSERIPVLIKGFEDQLILIDNDDTDFYKNENNRIIYSLVLHVSISYFDEALRNKNIEELKLFFQTYNDFYKMFEGQFVTTENIPNDVLLDLLHTSIFEGISQENKKFAMKAMPKAIKKMYKNWLK